MFRFSAAALMLLCASTLASAQDFAQFENTYHVEIRVEHWRIGNPSWVTEFSTNDYEEAVLMHDLFELALEQQSLPEMLGMSWQWLITDVRLRTEYPSQLMDPVLQSLPVSLESRRIGYEKPTYRVGN